MPYGLTAGGLIIKRLADIKAELEASFKGEFGTGVNLQAQGPFGQMIGIWSEREALLWELVEAIYNGLDPATAEGVPLQKSCNIVGVTKQEATYSTVTVTCTGTPATVILIGTIFSVSGNPLARFLTDYQVTIAGGGTVSVECTAETAGAVIANAASLTVIETPVSGLDSITNALDADVGNNDETDAELRYRRNLSLQQSQAATLEAIRTVLLEVEDVDNCVGEENITGEVDGDGRPPHSFEMVVQGGTDANIATAIWESKPTGIKSHGTEMYTVTDSQGKNRDIYFSRATEIDIYVIVDITRISGILPTEAQVKQKIIDYGDGLNLSDDVLPVSGIIPKIAELANIKDITIKVGTAPAPTLDDPITIDATEIAVFSTVNITVNFI